MNPTVTARTRPNRLPALVAAALLACTAILPAAAAADCAATCHAWEFLGAADNGDGSSTVRWSITNHCNRALSHASFEIPAPAQALRPADGGVYTGITGRQYGIENLTNNPFRSIKFETLGEGIRDGDSEVFVFVVDTPFAADAAVRIEAKSATTQEILTVVPQACADAPGPVATPTPTDAATASPTTTATATAAATATPVETTTPAETPTPAASPVPTDAPGTDGSGSGTVATPAASPSQTPVSTPVATATPVATPVTTAAPVATPISTPAPVSSGGCGVSIAKSFVGLPQPGTVIEYRLVWSTTCAGTSVVNVFDRLPDEVDLVSVASDAGLAIAENDEVNIQAQMTAGQALTATIKARIRGEVAEGTVVCNEATVRDAADRSAAAIACLRVSAADRLRLFTKAHSNIRPNRFLTVLTRYHRVSAANQMVMTLPERASIVRIFNPQPDRIDGRVLTWNNLPASAGKVKVTLQVDADAPQGTILPTEAVLTDATGIEFYNTATVVISESDPEMNGKAPQLSFAMPGKVIAGLSNSFKLRYKHVSEPVRLEVLLPAEIVIESSVPAFSTSESGRVVWNLLPGGSGAVSIRARIAGNAADGSVLSGLATLSHGGGILQSEASATVRALGAMVVR